MKQSTMSVSMAAVQPIGSIVQIAGLVVSARHLGAMMFLVIRDTSSEVQAIVLGKAQDSLRNRACPFYASLTGTVRFRPPSDVRRNCENGSIEIRAEVVSVYGPSSGSWQPALDHSLRWLTFLQARGFVDVHVMARMLAPSCKRLLREADPESLRHFTYQIGPCRWYFLHGRSTHFGLTPGALPDLQRIIIDDVRDAGSGAQDFAENSAWYSASTSDESELLPMAWGVVGLHFANDVRPNEAKLWRDRLSLAHVNDHVLSAAVKRSDHDEIREEELKESLARGEALLRGIFIRGSDFVESSLVRDIPQFDLHGSHIERLLALYPSLDRHLGRSTIEQQFGLLWSILGHDHVHEICSSEKLLEQLSECIRAGILTDYNILRGVDAGALGSIVALTQHFGHKLSCDLISNLANAAPGFLSSSVHLMAELDRLDLDWTRCVPLAVGGTISHLAFVAAALQLAPMEEIASWRQLVAARSTWLFANKAFVPSQCEEALNHASRKFPWSRDLIERFPGDLTFDVVHLTYGNGLIPYGEAKSLFRNTTDCSHHWALAGIELRGERWNEESGAFGLTQMAMYPSKNRASVLAKSCSGICSARDAALFHREDHFQFTLVDRVRLAAAGTIQLYCCLDELKRKTWVVRGVNPSERMMKHLNPVELTLEVLDTIASLARLNNVEAVLVGDGSGLYNSDSGRLAIRTVLRRLAAAGEWVRLEKPLHVYSFHGRPVSIDRGWRVWP